jgi:CBS domain-containing protein
MGKVKHILLDKGNLLFSIPPETTVFEALDIMVKKNIGALVVTENGKLKGIFTERDYARKVILKGKSSKDTHVAEIMDYHPTVTPDTTVEECMNLMNEKNMRHLPVLEGDKLVGLVSIGDVVKYIIDEQKYIIEHLANYISDTK